MNTQAKLSAQRHRPPCDLLELRESQLHGSGRDFLHQKNGNQPQEMIARKEILVSKKWHSQLEYKLDCLAT